jgi:hypothetical protein
VLVLLKEVRAFPCRVPKKVLIARQGGFKMAEGNWGVIYGSKSELQELMDLLSLSLEVAGFSTATLQVQTCLSEICNTATGKTQLPTI